MSHVSLWSSEWCTVEMVCGDDKAGRRAVQEMLDRQPH